MTATVIGATAWRGPISLLMLTAVVPWLIFVQPSRGKATVVGLAYFAAVSTPIIPLAKSFRAAREAEACLLWLVVSSLLVIPWAILWTGPSAARFWRCPLALLVSTLPPLGLIGWGSPLTAAGCLFPGMGLWGLGLCALVPVARGRALLVLAATSITANVLYEKPASPKDIAGINTTELGSEFLRDDSARRSISGEYTRLIILPEGTVSRWNEATEVFWADTIASLKATGRMAVVGVGRSISNSEQYRNSAILIGASTTRPFDQRVPVPLGMWRPFGSANGVPLNLFGPGTMVAGSHRLGILICYEQLLVWPVVASALEHPDVLAGLSNADVTKGTHVPAVQDLCLRAWSRLFGIPYISAVHS